MQLSVRGYGPTTDSGLSRVSTVFQSDGLREGGGYVDG